MRWFLLQTWITLPSTKTSTSSVVKSPTVKKTMVKVLDADQVAKLAETIEPEYRTLIYTAAYTGARAGELAALRVQDLDLLRRRVTIARSLSSVGGVDHFLPPKNNQARSFGIPQFLADLLAAHLVDRPHEPEDLVFTGERGGPFRHSNFYRRSFQPAVKKAGLPEGLRFHDLRHTCASLLIEQNIHAEVISERLGHSSIAITMDRYGHLFPRHQDVVADALEATFKAATKAESPEPAEVVTLGR